MRAGLAALGFSNVINRILALDIREKAQLNFLRQKDRNSVLVRWDELSSESVTYELFCCELRVPRIKTKSRQFSGTENYE